MKLSKIPNWNSILPTQVRESSGSFPQVITNWPTGCGDWLEIHFPGLGWKHMYFQVEDNDVDARVVYRSGQGSPNAMSYEVSLKSVKKVTESKLKYGFIVTTEEKVFFVVFFAAEIAQGVESLPTDRKQIHIQAKTAELRQK